MQLNSRPFKVVVILTATLAAAGCSTVLSSKRVAVSEPQTNALEANGGYYFLPRGLVKLTIEYTASSDTVNVNVGDVTYVADYDFMYALTYSGSANSDDKIFVETNSHGLLTKVSATVKDEFPQVFEKIAEGIASIVLPVPGARVRGERDFSVTVVIDPVRDLERFNERFREYVRLDIDPDPIPFVQYIAATNVSCPNGLCVRPSIPYALSFIDTRTDSLIVSTVVNLPNRAPVLEIEVKRSSFVERQTVLSFSDGLLTSVDIKKPSEVVGFISIPVDVAKAIVAVPAELVQLRIVSNNQDKAILDAQKGEIQARQQLIDAQKTLLESERSLDDARVPPGLRPDAPGAQVEDAGDRGAQGDPLGNQ